MKKIYKKLGTLGAAILPTAAVLSCAQPNETNPAIADSDLNNDQMKVNQLMDHMKNQPLDVSEYGGSLTLPSEVETELELKGVIIDEFFEYPPDPLITIGVNITSRSNLEGTLTVEITIERGQASVIGYFHFTGFLTTKKSNDINDVNTVIANIKNNPGQVSSYGKTILPSTITTQAELEKSIDNLPITSSTDEVIIVTTPISKDNIDIDGSLDVKFTVSKGEFTDETTITYSGFLTIDKRDQNIIDKDIDEINKLPTEAFPAASAIYSTEVKTEVDLAKYVTLPNITDGVEMTVDINSWDKDWGNIKVTYSLSKGNAAKSTTVTYTGFHMPFVASSKQVEGIPNVYGGWVQPINATHYLIGTYTDGVYQVELNPVTGEVIKTKPLPMTEAAAKGSDQEGVWIPSVAFGWSEKLNDAHYLIGTQSDGVYQVEVNPDTGYIIKTVQIPTDVRGKIGIPTNTGSGVIVKLAETTNYYHYLIGTSSYYAGESLIQVTVAKNTNSVIKTVSLRNKPFSLKDGWVEKINENHFLLGSKAANIWEMAVDVNDETEKVEIIATQYGLDAWSQSVGQGWAQRIGDEGSSHYLVGTNQNGVYQIEVDPNTGLIIHGSEQQVPMVGENSIPQVNTGWSQKIDATNYLIWTYDKGVYRVEVSPETGKIIKAGPVATAGEFGIPIAAGGFSQRIGNTDNFFIGTEYDNLYIANIKIS